MIDTIAVTTEDPATEILAARNSAAWSINVRRWTGQLRYLLCIRKSGGERRAFLICKNLRFVQDIDATNRSKGKRRKYAIEFDEFAVVDTPAKWKKSQNPVQFGELSDLLPKGTIPSEFQKAPPKKPNAPRFSYSRKQPDNAGITGMSVAEAKRALAARFGVPEEAITITIQA